jgi:hypothetical protein
MMLTVLFLYLVEGDVNGQFLSLFSFFATVSLPALMLCSMGIR